MEEHILLLREKIKIAESATRLAYFQHFDAQKMLHTRATLIDEVLIQLFQIWSAKLPPSFSPSLLAVGGYGRQELFPHSDIDLFILIPKEVPELDLILEDFVAQLWNLGLKIAHSVRTIAQALEDALEETATQTTLLEGRFLAGNWALFLALNTRLRAMIDPVDFLRLKRFEQKERHQRFNNTPYNLEPNIKESPGGLRDLHTVIWLSRIAGLGENFQALSRNGLLTAEGLKIIESTMDFLTQLRIRLHYLTGKAEDRLLFDYQEELAKSFHWQGRAPVDSATCLMQHYYQNAKVVMLVSQILNQSILNTLAPELIPEPQKIDAHFQAMGELLDLVDASVFQQKPHLIFDAFLKMQTMPQLKAMSAAMIRSLWQARFQIDQSFRQNRENQQQFLQLLQSKKHVVRELSRLNELDLLGAYIPDFGKIVGQMQYDLFHAYTVDQHTFQVCQNLENFRNEELAHVYPLMSRLMDSFFDHKLLFLAALFHDIAKGQGADHAELGAQIAQKFCVLHHLTPEETDWVVWLVRHHLKMSLVAQKEDLTDWKTIAQFAHFVADITHLNALYLLTHADIRATGPHIWNTWKAKLLEELYFATHQVLQQKEMASPSAAGVVAQRQEEALQKLRYFALPSAITNGFWKTLDAVYFMRHSSDEIAWHTKELHYQWANDAPIVASRLIEEALQVMIYTPDSPDLFTRLVGFFARQNFNVLDAKIHTTEKKYALDTFILLDCEKQPLNKKVLKNIERLILKVLKNPTQKDEPILNTRLSRQLKYFPIKSDIVIRADENKLFYRLYITTADRPGLLYLIANELKKAKIVLHSARIITMGDRAEDVFLISGDYLNDENMRLKLERDIMQAIKI